ncbi:hypothetical protein [Amycolatopsis sp. EV170708-02-1]|uniref:hypothetical protein n=1 Tax=Amycolatopsis sp. EV170708-02-1 TaxID=2919322 RepID=UPI001F0C10A4|nr:hypothetical protein [Amycolatopsis sp. EV170708-02-1]UMP06666.1 hypothetical protein MJQ72_18475 [Amycolatopsis sp. EV170708-02-1]
MPGRDGGYLPGGPYTLTQGVVFLVLLLVVWKLPLLDWLGPARWGVPLSAIAVRRARIESRTPASWLVGLVAHLLAPSSGMLAGRAYRPERPVSCTPRFHLHGVDVTVDNSHLPVDSGPPRSSLQRLLAGVR